MASDRQRQRRRRPRPASDNVGLPADDVRDAGLGEPDNGEVDPNGPLGQALPDVTEARLAEEGATPPAVGGRHQEDVEEREIEHPTGPRKGLFGRAADFLRASWAELKRVQWPDRRQVGQGTAVTIGFVIVAGAYLGALDAIWNPIIQAIL
jgi:preprotein translocase SecE subunit